MAHDVKLGIIGVHASFVRRLRMEHVVALLPVYETL